MKLLTVSVVLVVLLFTASAAKVHLLTEETFEHDTQAATGATTGNWFVMFKSESCGFCHQARPAFDALSDSAEDHATNIAVVDCSDSEWVCTRFAINSYPSFIMFARGKMYKYTGSRSTEDFIKFISGEYINSAEAVAVPPPLTFTGKIASSMSMITWEEIALIKEHVPILFYGVVGATCVLFVLIVLLCLMTLSESKAAPKSSSKKRPVPPAAKPAAANNSEAKKKQ